MVVRVRCAVVEPECVRAQSKEAVMENDWLARYPVFCHVDMFPGLLSCYLEKADCQWCPPCWQHFRPRISHGRQSTWGLHLSAVMLKNFTIWFLYIMIINYCRMLSVVRVHYIRGFKDDWNFYLILSSQLWASNQRLFATYFLFFTKYQSYWA